MTGVYTVGSVEDTWALARRVASELKPGDVVCLEGDLGAGKTTFTQGLAAALGATGRVTSPTFCIVREHPLALAPAAREGSRFQVSGSSSVTSHLEPSPLNLASKTSNLEPKTSPLAPKPQTLDPQEVNDFASPPVPLKLLVHMDLYRLNGEEDVEAIGWDDYLARGAILAVEWPDRAGSLIPPTARHLVFRHAGTDAETRTISID